MIHTIRKHSKWLLYIITAMVIGSFVFFMGRVGMNGGGAGGGEAVNTNDIGGEIYGQQVTPEMYDRMHNEVALDVFFRSGQWPEQNPELTHQALQESIYVRMLEVQKAKELGVHVTDEQAQKAAANILRSPELERAFGMENESVPMNSFIARVLEPERMTADDFENYVRDDLAIEQLRELYGVPGELVTPQEATNEYIRNYQEYSAQIVFFSASNYLDRVSVSPKDVEEFYTNYMADYRQPVRVKVNYVLFSVTNYLGEAQNQLGESNLDLQVQGIFAKYGMQVTPDAKTTNEALADIRNILIRRQALQVASTNANNFVQSVFNMEPVSPNNLATAARKNGMTVEYPVPFAADYGPVEFTAPAAFTQAAFQLTPDSPISLPVAGQNGVYILALETNLPSEIPPLEQIRGRVADDLRMRLATITAQRAGTNYAMRLPIQMAVGKSFMAAAYADGLEPLVLPPFSLSTEDMPELDNHATIGQLKEVAVATPVGRTSPFMQTDDGGFILYVQSQLPIDDAKMAADLPEFMERLRQSRAQQAYGDWIQHEASRQLVTTPLKKEMMR
ncbi:MAG TPA: peptidylprolyl isomerase [Alphaproteobacteria bacterium]|nr:peptidylprolyl isomerase [Alphaproteobacteria bacterium]